MAEWKGPKDGPIIHLDSGVVLDGKLYAAPFYGESSFIMYRTDLMEKAGLTMPDAPTWEFVADAARKMTDRANDINGICLRGKAGWGENMAFLTATSNSFGARWFDENWVPQFDQPEWKNTLDFYVKLMNDAGPREVGGEGRRRLGVGRRSGVRPREDRDPQGLSRRSSGTPAPRCRPACRRPRAR